MKVEFDGRHLYIEEATDKDIIWPNFAGREKRGEHGEIYNMKGKRNFNLVIPDKYLDIFVKNDARVKINKNYPDEKYVMVNVRTDSENPPRLGILSADKQHIRTVDPRDYIRFDSMYIESADFRMNFSSPTQDGKRSLYLDEGVFLPHRSRYDDKWEDKWEEGTMEFDPNGPDRAVEDEEEEIPFK